MSKLIKPRYLVFPITEDMIKSGLKGNYLIVYAFIVYKANNSLDGSYRGGLNEICRLLKLTQSTVISIVKQLVSGGYIKKEYFIDENKNKKCSLTPIYDE